MNKQEAHSLLREVRENQDRLRNCKVHSFGPVLGDKVTPLGNRYQCKKCLGNMKSHDIYVYAQGFHAAGGNSDEVATFVDGTSLFTV